MNLGDLNKVWEVKALKKAGEEEAKKMLDQIAKQVQPIMRKRKWRVKVLSEFCPKNPALLGLNVARGVHVKLRLRRANRDWDFIPYDQVLDTMLHELCHNVHGPHNANFYKLWDELRKECEELLSKGISGTGEGFDMPGKRLGGFSRQPPLSSLHKTALAAAEKRAKLGSMHPSGPKRLGGDSTIMGALSPIQAAAMAAERRLRDEIWCASQFADISEDGESITDISEDIVDLAQSAENSIPTIGQKRICEQNSGAAFLPIHGYPASHTVELPADVSTSRSTFDEERKRIKRSCHLENNSSSGSSFVDLTSDPSVSTVSHRDVLPNTEEIAMWECGICTLLNPPLAPICDLCCTEKPKDASSKYKMWACKFCTLDNSVKSDKCSACNQWRYSNGPPVSIRSPNPGT